MAARKTHAKDKHRTNRWSHKVTTVSTYPPQDLFTKDAETVAAAMASKKVSPRGLGSGIRMIQFYINRAGSNLPVTRKRELEKAKKILQERLSRRNRAATKSANAARFRHRTSAWLWR